MRQHDNIIQAKPHLRLIRPIAKSTLNWKSIKYTIENYGYYWVLLSIDNNYLVIHNRTHAQCKPH